jgi:hypothetical protein
MSDILSNIIRSALHEQFIPVEEPKPKKKPTSSGKKSSSPAKKSPTTNKSAEKPKTAAQVRAQDQKDADEYVQSIGGDDNTGGLYSGFIWYAAIAAGSALALGYLGKRFGKNAIKGIFGGIGKYKNQISKLTDSKSLTQFEEFIDAEYKANRMTAGEYKELKRIITKDALTAFRNEMVASKHFNDFSRGQITVSEFLERSPQVFRDNNTYRVAAQNYYDEVISKFYPNSPAVRNATTSQAAARATGVTGAIFPPQVKQIPKGNWTQIQIPKGSMNDIALKTIYLDAGISDVKTWLTNEGGSGKMLEKLANSNGAPDGIYIPTEYLTEGTIPDLNTLASDIIRLGGNKNISDTTLRTLQKRYEMILELVKY